LTTDSREAWGGSWHEVSSADKDLGDGDSFVVNADIEKESDATSNREISQAEVNSGSTITEFNIISRDLAEAVNYRIAAGVFEGKSGGSSRDCVAEDNSAMDTVAQVADWDPFVALNFVDYSISAIKDAALGLNFLNSLLTNINLEGCVGVVIVKQED
jgi:hypothetical protein